jgi:hypothetical protein
MCEVMDTALLVAEEMHGTAVAMQLESEANPVQVSAHSPQLHPGWFAQFPLSSKSCC